MQTWTIHKPQVTAAGGMVAAQHGEAARAGAAVLAQGGNAMDAAVVTALALSVVEPWLSGIGGGGFLLHADGATGAVETLDFNVRAARGLAADDYPLAGGRDGDWFDWPAVVDDRNLIGYGSICVPGTVAGLAAALERHGTLSWAEALAPAIALAERGLEVDWFTALCLAIDGWSLARFPASAALFLDEGRPLRTPAAGGARFRPMPVKARTLRRLAEAGARDFYGGEIARLLVADLRAGGSPIAAADLADYRPVWRAPATTRYRGHTIHAIAGLSGGPALIATMDSLAAGLRPGASPDADAALIFAKAIRASYHHRLTAAGHAAGTADCTSHLSVVDRHGSMVSLTNTILSRFGSKVVLPRTGFLLNNGMMWFDPRPGVPNAIAPGAQPLANMSPLLVTRDRRPILAIGAAGGRQIFPTLVQLLSYVIDYGMTLEAAFHAPRIDASTPTIRVNRAAAPDVAARIAEVFPVEIVTDTVHPVHFAVPSAVGRDPAAGVHTGMVHPNNPWACVATEEAADAERAGA